MIKKKHNWVWFDGQLIPVCVTASFDNFNDPLVHACQYIFFAPYLEIDAMLCDKKDNNVNFLMNISSVL